MSSHTRPFVSNNLISVKIQQATTSVPLRSTEYFLCISCLVRRKTVHANLDRTSTAESSALEVEGRAASLATNFSTDLIAVNKGIIAGAILRILPEPLVSTSDIDQCLGFGLDPRLLPNLDKTRLRSAGGRRRHGDGHGSRTVGRGSGCGKGRSRRKPGSSC